MLARLLDRPHDRSWGRLARVLATACAALLLGALLGAIVGLSTPAKFDIAGSDATVRVLPGRSYDEFELNGNTLNAKRPTTRSVLGEPIGISVQLDLDPSTFVTPDGSFNANVVPVYVQAYSDPEQLASDLAWAVAKHLIVWTVAGAVAGLVLFLARSLRDRRRREELDRLPETHRATVRDLWAQQARQRARVLFGIALILVVAVVPSGVRQSAAQPALKADPILDNTPLAGTQIGGLFRPALDALQNYIQTYFADTNSYYNALRDKLLDSLQQSPVELPTGDKVANLVFVTDRHCNIGMDRVIVALARHFGITTIVSGGDDDFSGSFPFESACTANLAAKSQRAGMTDVFVAGNHDSVVTRENEATQHIHVLDGVPVFADGLTFIGLPDPRSSRYGQGIRPASKVAQDRLLVAQGRKAGLLACNLKGPVVAVLHDPLAGQEAIATGCGRVTVALDGHTHNQGGPTKTDAGGTTAYRFTGGSTGGAPGEYAVERSFASSLTVGPLNYPASINIVSIDRATGALVGVTVWHIRPDQSNDVEHLAP
jgi:predicted MPP superfamily phosphohydrolase